MDRKIDSQTRIKWSNSHYFRKLHHFYPRILVTPYKNEIDVARRDLITNKIFIQNNVYLQSFFQMRRKRLLAGE